MKRFIPLLAILALVVGAHAQTYITAIYKTDRGDKQVVADGGEVEVQSGGEFEMLSGATLDVQSGVTVTYAGNTTFSDKLTSTDTVKVVVVEGTSDKLTIAGNDTLVVARLEGVSNKLTLVGSDTFVVAKIEGVSDVVTIAADDTLKLTTLSVSGNGTITGTLTVTSTITASGNLDVTGTVTVDTLDAATSYVTGNLDVDGTATFDGNVDVTGALDVDGKFTTDTADVSVADVATNIIHGASTLSAEETGVLDGVTPGTAAASKVLVPDANLDIATVNKIGADSVVTGDLDVATNFTHGANILSASETGVLDAVTPGTATASKAAVLGTSREIDSVGVAVVLDDIKFDSAATFGASVTCSSTLGMTGTLTASGDADVTGTMTVDTLNATTTTVTGDMNVDGTLTATENLDVTGTVTVDTLDASVQYVTGPVSLDSLMRYAHAGILADAGDGDDGKDTVTVAGVVATDVCFAAAADTACGVGCDCAAGEVHLSLPWTDPEHDVNYFVVRPK